MDNFTCPISYESCCTQILDKSDKETKDIRKIHNIVLLTIIFFALLFLLGSLKRRFAKLWLKYLSYPCFIVVPILISYTFGLMGTFTSSQSLSSFFTPFSVNWAVFLLFAYTSFDNLGASSLGDISSGFRLNLLSQFLSQGALLLNILFTIMNWNERIPYLLVFLFVCYKVIERIVALALSDGATPTVKEAVKKIIDYNNEDDDEEGDGDGDLTTMKGFKYLVGSRYATMKEGKIGGGVTLEKIWGSKGWLLSSHIGQLKDTCLSFSLFWVLLGKIRGHPNLYAGNSSRTKAWKMVHDGLLVDQERAFKVIEVELNFLQDYFYTKYMFIYLNGIYWKLISFIAWTVMAWHFIVKDFPDAALLSVYKNFGIFPYVVVIVISILYALEAIQFFMFLNSRWYKVILMSYYAKLNGGFLKWCLGVFIGVVCGVSSCTKVLMSKPWKKRLSQYSLLDSCTRFNTKNRFSEAIGGILGFSILPNPSRKQGKSVALSDHLKTAIVVSLQTTNGSKLSKGISSLKENVELAEKLDWACKLKKDSETILVWHIATSICEMSDKDQEKMEGFKVATELSKYCAYLLAHAPSLVSIPVFEAEISCETVIKEARGCLLIRTPISLCGKLERGEMYNELIKLKNIDKEAGEERMTTLQKGVKLGEVLSREGKRWEILAGFWAKMILFLAASDNTEMVHVQKLEEGGEFITHLWALLINAGIVERSN